MNCWIKRRKEGEAFFFFAVIGCSIFHIAFLIHSIEGIRYQVIEVYDNVLFKIKSRISLSRTKGSFQEVSSLSAFPTVIGGEGLAPKAE